MSRKILIVDDEKDVCDAARETLEHEGFLVKTMTSGQEAIDACANERFDLILVDIRLEGKVTGIDVIKGCNNVAGNPKIAILSATPPKYLEPIFKEHKIDHLIHGFLEKPSDMLAERLIKKVNDFLK